MNQPTTLLWLHRIANRFNVATKRHLAYTTCLLAIVITIAGCNNSATATPAPTTTPTPTPTATTSSAIKAEPTADKQTTVPTVVPHNYEVTLPSGWHQSDRQKRKLQPIVAAVTEQYDLPAFETPPGWIDTGTESSFDATYYYYGANQSADGQPLAVMTLLTIPADGIAMHAYLADVVAQLSDQPNVQVDKYEVNSDLRPEHEPVVLVNFRVDSQISGYQITWLNTKDGELLILTFTTTAIYFSSLQPIFDEVVYSIQLDE